MKKAEIFEKAFDLWGHDEQVMMLVEEFGELFQAINKMRRQGVSEGLRARVVEELADVRILLGQMEWYYEGQADPFNTGPRIQDWEVSKMARLERLVREGLEAKDRAAKAREVRDL